MKSNLWLFITKHKTYIYNMKKINLKKIIEDQDINVKDLSKQLFPKNKYPRLALNRVISGEAVLDANQISKLALIVNVDISKLYGGSSWKSKIKKNIHTFSNGSFRAELNTDTWVTKLFDNDSMFHESVIHSGSIPLSEYLDQLSTLISKYKNHE